MQIEMMKKECERSMKWEDIWVVIVSSQRGKEGQLEERKEIRRKKDCKQKECHFEIKKNRKMV